MQKDQMDQLLYEALETEMGGVKVYETAIGASRAKQSRKEML